MPKKDNNATLCFDAEMTGKRGSDGCKTGRGRRMETRLDEDQLQKSEAEQGSGQAQGHGVAGGQVQQGGGGTLGIGGTAGTEETGGDGFARRLRGRGRLGGRSRLVGLEGFLGTAGVVGTALVRTCVVTIAVGDTVGAPLGADEVGHGLRVLCDVGRRVVFADALEFERVRVTVVGDCVLGRDTGLLEADEWALRLLLLAPEVSRGVGNGVGVDLVLLLGR